MKIRKKINTELCSYARLIDKTYSLKAISPLLSASIKSFISRKGKLIRPTLFAASYLGFTRDEKKGLYRSAISLELLHNFMLVHDDIIDKSPLRRGFPSMHAMLDQSIKKYPLVKFSGEDLAIIAGDVMFAMALDAFLAIDEKAARKEAALRRLIQTAVRTGSGQFIELLYGAKKINRISKEDIYRIYDLKTANYTFATPLCMGAELAGADKEQIKMIFNLGIRLGRAFQIHDDLIGIFAEEDKIGKSNLTDLQESKKTILMWYAYNNASVQDRSALNRIMDKRTVTKEDLFLTRKIMKKYGTDVYARTEISKLLNQATSLSACSRMRPVCKSALMEFARKALGA